MGRPFFIRFLAEGATKIPIILTTNTYHLGHEVDTNMNVYEIVTEKITEQLNKGIIPWRRPWDEVRGAGSSALYPCISYTTGKPYSLLNQVLLGFKAGEYLTFKQIQNLGGKIKRGETASVVTFWDIQEYTKKNADGENIVDDLGFEEKGKRAILRYYNVFNIDQCEGIKPKQRNKAIEEREIGTANEQAENIIAQYFANEAVTLQEGMNNEAFYNVELDYVEVPTKKQYKVLAQYYSTLFHEMTHSTGAACRLNRNEVVVANFFGSEDYSREELVAEMGAAFLCAICGLDCEKAFNNSVAYLNSWSKRIKEDAKMFVYAAAKAEKAVEYILQYSK